jgi:hypothetical protein
MPVTTAGLQTEDRRLTDRKASLDPHPAIVYSSGLPEQAGSLS